MRVRARVPLALAATAALAAAAAPLLAGVHADGLIAAPVVLLVLPLAAGRYVGSRALPAKDP